MDVLLHCRGGMLPPHCVLTSLTVWIDAAVRWSPASCSCSTCPHVAVLWMRSMMRHEPGQD
jgi:hypothetical protein